MKAFLYQAALYCGPCGQSIRDRIQAEGKAPTEIGDEESYDSDDFPKGPYPDGGGEAETEQHCDACGAALDNPLTEEGQRARAARLAPKYLDMEQTELASRRSIMYSAGDLRAMLDTLEEAYELLPLTEEGHAVFDGMIETVQKELQKIEFHFYSEALN